jgi:hypothetical protein
MINDTLETQTNRIADAIVELVERTDGPVTLAQVDREVPGFAGHAPPFWNHVVMHAGGETSFWYDMSEAGLAALLKVMRGRRVAIQFVNVLLYFVEDRLVDNENWQPIVLLPARAANMDTPNWLIRVPEWCRDKIAKEGRPGYRLREPGVVGAAADMFFG